MNWGSKAVIGYAVAMVIAFVTIGLPSAHAQSVAPTDEKAASSDQKPLVAEDVFKNVQLLRGISVKEFLDTMGFFSAATGMNCIDCHSPEAADSMEAYAIDSPLKQTSRKMILMVRMLNQTTFGGQRKVTCYTCHRANEHPGTIPTLLEQYSTEPDDPDQAEIAGDGAAVGKKVSSDQILDKYIQAIGGAAQVAKLSGFVAKGTHEGFDTYHETVPMEIFAKAPNQLTTVVHAQKADSVTTFDGSHGWVAASDKLMRVLPLAGGDLEGAKIDAAIFFPAALKQDFKWRTGFPSVSIDDRPVQVIQEAGAGAIGAKLYFDNESGLLVRQVRYTDTIVGVIPTQIDYSDYRTVAGVKVPFKWVVTFTDDLWTIELSDVQPNAHIDATKFAIPPAPKAKTVTP